MNRTRTPLILLFLLLAGPLPAQTWGPPTLVSGEGEVANAADICRLDGRHFLAAYTDNAARNGQVALVRMEAGKLNRLDTLAFDEDGTVRPGIPPVLLRLSDTRFLLLYQDEPPVGRALVGEVADGALRWAGPSTVFSHPSKAAFFTAAALDEERVLIAFFGESDRKGRVLAARVADGKLVPGPANAFLHGKVNAFNSLAVLPQGEFVLAYTANTDGGQAVLRAGRVEGDAVKIGPPFQLDSRNSPYINVLPAGGDLLLVGYHTGEGHQFRLVRHQQGAFEVVDEHAAESAGPLLEVVALGGDAFAYSYRNDGSDRDSEVWTGEIAGGAIRTRPLAKQSRQASLQNLCALHPKVLVLAHTVNPHSLEAAALAVVSP